MKIGVIVTFYENDNQEYLDLCLQSLLNQNKVETQIIVVSSSVERPNVPDNVQLVMQPRENTIVDNYNLGATYLTDCEYIVIANDDIIVASNTLHNLSTIIGQSKIILNATSNCDNRIFFNAEIVVRNEKGEALFLEPSMRMHQIKGFEKALMEFNPNLQFPMIMGVSWLSMYFTMMPKSIWDELEGFDLKNLRYYGEDVDFGWRAGLLGYGSFFTPNAFCFHFAGTTTAEGWSMERKQKGMDLFKIKWDEKLGELLKANAGKMP